MTHTPGPWKIAKTRPDDHHVYIDGPDWLQIATAVWRVDDDERTPQAEANARLIAAAPELLDALKNLVDTINNNGSKAARLDATAFAMSAIAKAEGAEK